MKRRVLFVLTLLICLARLLPQSLPGLTPHSTPSTSALTARAKQPFPFNVKQLIKKRLGSPPAMRSAVFQGFSGQSQPAITGLSPGDIWPLHQWCITVAAALFPPSYAAWHSRAIEQNVFHPPPVA